MSIATATHYHLAVTWRRLSNCHRSVIFPGFYGNSNVKQSTVRYHIGVNMERLHKLLTRQIMAGLLFNQDCHCSHSFEEQELCRKNAEIIALTVLKRYPDIRRMLSSDVEAAFEGDPAAINEGEVICCYPVIKALTNYRIAHELYREEVPLIPRMMTELAHSETGIDIHPAATIGKHFTIDHGTGVVIGATCIIGENVKLYQGVTLGAKSFPLTKTGNQLKAYPDIQSSETMSLSMPTPPSLVGYILATTVSLVPMYGLLGT